MFSHLLWSKVYKNTESDQQVQISSLFFKLSHFEPSFITLAHLRTQKQTCCCRTTSVKIMKRMSNRTCLDAVVHTMTPPPHTHTHLVQIEFQMNDKPHGFINIYEEMLNNITKIGGLQWKLCWNDCFDITRGGKEKSVYYIPMEVVVGA